MLTTHDKLQLEMASRGMVSGTLVEWPHLKQAFRKAGYRLPDWTMKDEMQETSKKILEENNAI